VRCTVWIRTTGVPKFLATRHTSIAGGDNDDDDDDDGRGILWSCRRSLEKMLPACPTTTQAQSRLHRRSPSMLLFCTKLLLL
jgi:hypothetical protein